MGGHYSRIESNDTCPGFPDVHYTYQGQTGGMELKSHPFPNSLYPFAGEKFGLRKSQRIWIRDELAVGGKVILVLQTRQNIYFVDGSYYEDIERWKIEDLSKTSEVIWVNHSCSTPLLAQFMLRPPHTRS